MSQVKKLVLLDPSHYDQLAQIDSKLITQRQKPLPTKEINRLDRKMLHIVEDELMNDHEKLHAYTQALTDYQNLSDIISHNKTKKTPAEAKRPASSIPVKAKSRTSKESKPPKNSFTIGIPKQWQRKADSLIELINQQPDASIDAAGKLTIADTTFKSSHISDLINKAVNPNYNHGELEDWDQFSEFMDNINTPKSLFARKEKPINLTPSKAKNQNGINSRAKKKLKWSKY